MTASSTRLLVLLSICAGPISAQGYQGEPPTLMRPLADAGFSPATFGWILIDWMHHRLQPDGHHYFAMAGRASVSSPVRLAAWRRHPTTLVWTRTSDFDAITQDGDLQVTVSRDLLTCVLLRNTVGLLVSTRASTAAAWGPPRPISGLPTSAYSPSLGLRPAASLRSSGTQDILVSLRVSPFAVNVHDFDPATGLASNGQEFRPPVLATNTLGSVTGLEDAAGITRGTAHNERATAGFAQRYFVTAGLRGTSPYHAIFDTPANSHIPNICQIAGGTLYAPKGFFLQGSVLRVDLFGCFDAVEQNGQIGMAMFAPDDYRGFAVALIGIRGSAAIPIPGVGRLALAPEPIVLMGVAMSPSMMWNVGRPAGTGRADYQGLTGDFIGAWNLGGNAEIWW